MPNNALQSDGPRFARPAPERGRCAVMKVLLLFAAINTLMPSTSWAETGLGMVFKTPVKPEWRERCAAGTMAS